MRYVHRAENVRQVSAHERSVYQRRMKELGSASVQTPSCAFSHIHVTNVILRGREDATCGGYITFAGIMLLA